MPWLACPPFTLQPRPSRVTLKPLFHPGTELSAALDAGAAVLTPNRRLSRAVRAADNARRAGRGERAWPSAVIMPLRQYWHERWQWAGTTGRVEPRALLEARAQRLLWRRIIDEESTGFSLLSSARAAALCQSAFENVNLWGLRLDEPALRQEFEFHEDTRHFLLWAQAFQQALDAAGWITPEQAQRRLLRVPEAFERPLALLHTDRMPPLHERLCALAPRVQRLRGGAGRGCVAPVRAFASAEAELAAVAAWCVQSREADPQGRYGVVLSDMRCERDRLETRLRRALACLTGRYASLPVNFSTGFTLDRVPLVRDALGVLEVSAEQVDIERAIALLQSRFVRLPRVDGASGERQIRRLRELGGARLPQRVLRECLAPLGAPGEQAPWRALPRLEAELGLRRRPRPPSAWRAAFARLLEAWGWPLGSRLDSLEYQQWQRWGEALDGYAALDGVVGALDFEAAVSLLGECLAEEDFQPETADQSIQILGPLETTGLSFDGLWLTAMHAERWPAPAAPNPYLPQVLQRRLRLPHADAAWEWEWAQTRWRGWREGCERLQASYVYREEDRLIPPSPLLASLAERRCDDPPDVDPRWRRQQRDAEFTPVEPGCVAVDAAEMAALHTGSALLEAQALCPFQAFAAHRLQAHPARAASAGISPAERGTILHQALFLLSAHYPDRQTLRRADADARRAAIHGASAEALDAIRRERRSVLAPASLELEERRLRVLLTRWLELEAERELDWRIETREAERELVLGPLAIRLRLDRVDAVPGGRRIVLDYKSGRIDPLSHWLEERPRKPQLPLYALAEPEASAISYVSLRGHEIDFRGLGSDALIPGVEAVAGRRGDELEGAAAFAAQRDDWRRDLAALAGEFAAGQARPTPSAEACRYCARAALCRRDDAL